VYYQWTPLVLATPDHPEEFKPGEVFSALFTEKYASKALAKAEATIIGLSRRECEAVTYG
jgi:hypothetical protein